MRVRGIASSSRRLRPIGPALLVDSRKMAWRYGLSETVTIRIASTNELPMEIKFYAMYRPFDDMQEVVHVFQTSVIVVFDFGLHFMPSSDLIKC
jgi:hypothetical protein